MNFLNDDQQIELLNTLLKQTLENGANWIAGARSEYTFSLWGKKYAYIISSDDTDDEPPFSLKIYSTEDTGDSEIGTVTDKLLQTIEDDPFSPTSDLLNHLYGVAKRGALRMEQTSQEILNDFS